jgi:DNA-binding response OmpR family regulator
MADRAALRGMRIAIVEDAGIIANELKWMLEDVGCLVVGMAPTVQDAMLLTEKEQLDGVFLDLRLRGEVSYPVAETLRDRDIPFIIMSAYDHEQVRSDFRKYPHLQKPFTFDSMASAMVDAFLDGSHLTDGIAAGAIPP